MSRHLVQKCAKCGEDHHEGACLRVTRGGSFAAPSGSDAAVIVAEGYYRLKAERDDLLKIVGELYRLVVNHHSSVVMREDIVICPICIGRAGKRIMDRAYRALNPNPDSTTPIA